MTPDRRTRDPAGGRPPAPPAVGHQPGGAGVRAAPAWRAVAALAPPIAAGLAARLLLIAWTSPLRLADDEARFWNLAATRMADTAFLPPLYPMFLALVRMVAGDSIEAARLAGAALSVVTIACVWRLGERHLGPGSGGWPAWVAALFPALVYYDGRLRSEALVVPLLAAFAAVWTGRPAARPAGRAAAAVLAGLLVLARPQFVLLPVLLAATAGLRTRSWREALRPAWLLPGILLLVLPWAARNQHVVGSFALSTNTGFNFWKSFNPASDGSQIPVADFSVFESVEERDLDRTGFAAGWRYIREHPLRSLLLAPARIGHLLGPERDFLSDVRRGRFPRRSLAADLGFAVVQNAAWLLLLGLGLYALSGPARTPVKDATLAVLLNVVLVHLVFFGDDRFHVPLVPLFAAVLPEAWDGSLKPARAARLIAALLAAEIVFWGFIAARDLERIGSLWGG
jgi:4-amino-4-deoxy-L-arabinose transferase-like glycosyltransferase